MLPTSEQFTAYVTFLKTFSFIAHCGVGKPSGVVYLADVKPDQARHIFEMTEALNTC